MPERTAPRSRRTARRRHRSLISRNAVFQDAAVLTAFGMPETL